MNVHRDPSSEFVAIGDWVFSVSDGSLVRGGERRRLENRSAEVLRLLAGRRGTIVTQSELIGEIWDGRLVSANSVAIAIADIRRMLEDDARAPRFIETVPKRGYRLAPAASDPPPQASPRRVTVLAFALGAAVLLGVAGISILTRPAKQAPTVTVAAFANETGDKKFDPLALSVRELAVTELGRSEVVQLSPAGRGPALKLTGKLIIWSGHPSVSVALENQSLHSIVWTGMAPGPENALPAQMHGVMNDMERKFSR